MAKCCAKLLSNVILFKSVENVGAFVPTGSKIIKYVFNKINTEIS